MKSKPSKPDIRKFEKMFESMSDEQKSDIARMTNGDMTRENYERKWFPKSATDVWDTNTPEKKCWFCHDPEGEIKPHTINDSGEGMCYAICEKCYREWCDSCNQLSLSTNTPEDHCQACNGDGVWHQGGTVEHQDFGVQTAEADHFADTGKKVSTNNWEKEWDELHPNMVGLAVEKREKELIRKWIESVNGIDVTHKPTLTTGKEDNG